MTTVRLEDKIADGTVVGGKPAGTRLATVQPPTGSAYTVTLTTYAAIDATNLVASVVVPASGKLFCRFNFTANAANQQDAAIAILNGSAADAVLAEAYIPMLSGSVVAVYSVPFAISGLTPGATIQLKLAAKRATSNVSIYRGGGAYGGHCLWEIEAD